MVQVISAIFKDGVFQPDAHVSLSESTRVRLLVEPLEPAGSSERDAAWATLRQLWTASSLDSAGDRLTRDVLHDRR